jgi:hypothetical protein
MEVAKTMAHGTAVAAFEASSEICTGESNEPVTYITFCKQLLWLTSKMRTYSPDWSDETQNECKATRPVIHYSKSLIINKWK